MTITISTPETIGEIVERRSDMDASQVMALVAEECNTGLCTVTFRVGEPEIRFHNRPSEIILSHARAHKSAMRSALENLGADLEEVR